MPLYMDLHHIDPNITQEDLDKAHRKDLEVQDKYGVSHKKYYVNFEEKTIFCLMEGPNKRAVHSSHAEVHGVGPCNIIEVSSLTPTFSFNAMIGDEGGKNSWDVALTKSGEIDTGFRTLMLITLFHFSSDNKSMTKEIFQIIEKHEGKVVSQPGKKILVSFLHAQDGMYCLKSIKGYLDNTNNIEYNLALITGKPVDDAGSHLFENTIDRLKILCLLGQSKTAYLDSDTKSLFEKGLANIETLNYSLIQVISVVDFAILEELNELLENNLGNSSFRTEQISDALGLSKTQTYRKTKQLTGMSPSGLVLEVRLRKALADLRDTDRTISQIAYDRGFNSPNYFTRAFKKRFQLLPTEFAHLSTSIDQSRSEIETA